MNSFWDYIEYFHPDEFDSPDEVGSGEKYMDETLIRAMDYVRSKYGAPLRINSGYRTEEHNRKVGGVPNSTHRGGMACDVHIDSQEMGDKLEELFTDFLGEDVGIGKYNSFRHFDVRGHRARWDNRT